MCESPSNFPGSGDMLRNRKRNRIETLSDVLKDSRRATTETALVFQSAITRAATTTSA